MFIVSMERDKIKKVHIIIEGGLQCKVKLCDLNFSFTCFEILKKLTLPLKFWFSCV
jgi:hypothetical protein